MPFSFTLTQFKQLQVNLLVALEAVEEAVAAGDPRRVVVALNGVPGMRAPVRAASAEAYLAELTMALQGGTDSGCGFLNLSA